MQPARDNERDPADQDMVDGLVVVRSGQEPIVVNLDIESPEPAPHGTEPDPFHSKPN